MKPKSMRPSSKKHTYKKVWKLANLHCAYEKLAAIGIRACICHAQNSRTNMCHC